MRTVAVWGSALFLIWPVCTGCSSQQALIRGQDPFDSRGAIQHAFAETSASERPKLQQVNYSTMAAYGGYGGGQYCPPSNCPPSHCPPGHCHGYCMHGVLSHLCGICACLHWPHHHTTQSFSGDYNDPHLFVYPPPQQPPAVVQYPYYTVRGPSDFFMP